MKKYRSFDNYMPEGSAEDFKTDFQTPVPVANYMISLLPAGIRTVCEPTKGIGNISNGLIEAGYDVTAPHDYFQLDPDLRFDAFVMNPPFSHKFTRMEYAPLEVHAKGMRMGYWFLTDAMRRSDNVIALMPWFTISDSDVRLRMLKRYGLKSLTALPRKTFEFARIQTVVIELKRGYTGKTTFEAYDCLFDHEQTKLFDSPCPGAGE
jgi:hypothetical protein